MIWKSGNSGVNPRAFHINWIGGCEGMKKTAITLWGDAVAVGEDSLTCQSYVNNLYSFFE